MSRSKKPTVFEIYNLLPKTNCRKCGMTCFMFATKLLQGEVRLEDCPLLLEPRYRENYEKLKKLLEEVLPKKPGVYVEVVDPDKCTGCCNCVIACPANVSIAPELASGSIAARDDLIFVVVNGKVKLLHPELCRRGPPTKLECRVCEESCPAGIIRVH